MSLSNLHPAQQQGPGSDHRHSDSQPLQWISAIYRPKLFRLRRPFCIIMGSVFQDLAPRAQLGEGLIAQALANTAITQGNMGTVINSTGGNAAHRKLVSHRLPQTFSRMENLGTKPVQGQMFQVDPGSNAPFEHFSSCLLQRLQSRKCPLVFDLVSQRHFEAQM